MLKGLLKMMLFATIFVSHLMWLMSQSSGISTESHHNKSETQVNVSGEIYWEPLHHTTATNQTKTTSRQLSIDAKIYSLFFVHFDFED